MQPDSSGGLDDCNVFVKYLPPELTEGEFHLMFKPFGSVISSKIMVDTTGKSLGYGFVRFSSPEVCNKAISAMNGRKVANKRLLCKLANQSPASSPYGTENARNPILRQQLPSDNIYIKPLLLSTTEEDLMELFGKFGQITECKVMVDKNTGISHQIGFVRFSSTEEAKDAIQTMNGYKLHPSAVPLVVKYADTKEQKDARKTLRQQHSSSLDDFESGGYSPVFYYSPTTYAFSYPGTYLDDHYNNSPASDFYVGSYPTQQFYAQPYFYEGMPGYYYEGYAGPVGYDEATGQPFPEADAKDPEVPEKPVPHPRSKPRQTEVNGKDAQDEPAQEFRPSSPMTPSTPININYEGNSD